jgi:general secretion pathway protein C
MVGNMRSRWSLAAATFVVWALVAASLVYWVFKMVGNPASSSVPQPARTAAAPDPAALARLLGASPTLAAAAPVASLSSRFVLMGVVASTSHHGAALIAVDGRPARPFRVGTSVDPELVLQSVDHRRATLGASAGGPAVLTLELPAARK